MAVNPKMLTSALYKSVTTLQQCDFVLLSKRIQQLCENLLQIFQS